MFEEYNEDDYELIKEEPVIKEDSKDNEPIIVYTEETTMNFKEFPYSVQKRIFTQLAITILFNLAIIIFCIIQKFFSIELLVLMFVVDFILITNMLYIYDTFHYLQCRLFEGIVISYEDRGVPGTSTRYKRITICNDDSTKFLMFDYYGKGKIERGFPVLVYIDKNEKVKLQDELPYVKNILDIKFGVTSENEETLTNNGEDVNIESYFSSEE